MLNALIVDDLSLPDDVLALAAQAAEEGVRNVELFVERWIEGSERYDAPGEVVLGARTNDGTVVALGGLARCPHVAGALRVRRTYVAIGWRRRGVGRALAEQLIERGRRHADVLTCNAQASPAAAPFWESLGFRPVDDIAGITHIMRSARVVT